MLFQFGRIERAGGKNSEEGVRIRVHMFGELSLRKQACVFVCFFKNAKFMNICYSGKTFNTDGRGMCV